MFIVKDLCSLVWLNKFFIQLVYKMSILTLLLTEILKTLTYKIK